MQHHSDHDGNPHVTSGKRRRLLTIIGAVAVVVLIVVLHLTGTIGASSH